VGASHCPHEPGGYGARVAGDVSPLANNSAAATIDTRPLTMSTPSGRLARIPAWGGDAMKLSKLSSDLPPLHQRSRGERADV